jgi:hypothetical protein
LVVFFAGGEDRAAQRDAHYCCQTAR